MSGSSTIERFTSPPYLFNDGNFVALVSQSRCKTCSTSSCSDDDDMLLFPCSLELRNDVFYLILVF